MWVWPVERTEQISACLSVLAYSAPSIGEKLEQSVTRVWWVCTVVLSFPDFRFLQILNREQVGTNDVFCKPIWAFESIQVHVVLTASQDQCFNSTSVFRFITILNESASRITISFCFLFWFWLWSLASALLADIYICSHAHLAVVSEVNGRATRALDFNLRTLWHSHLSLRNPHSVDPCRWSCSLCLT